MEREIRPSDWTRFRKYASLVRTFTFSFAASSTLDLAWYQNLHMAACGEPLLPNIKEFSWTATLPENTMASFPFILLFMGPHLSKFSISDWNGEASAARRAVFSLIASLPARYPNLIDVSISLEGAGGRAVISAAVMGWNRLQRLTVHDISPDALTHIASLPNLHTVRIAPPADMILPLHLPPPAFPALRQLSIETEKLSLSTQFLQLWPTPSRCLSNAHFCGDEDLTSTSTWTDISKTVADKFSPETLSCLEIEDYSYWRSDIDQETAFLEFVVPAKSLRPLFAFSHLTKADLWASHGFDLDDAFIVDLAKAWPRIKTRRSLV
ncbi:hypothetical protein DXG03_002583 [Asterophora parasitica]|uniref:Uncharacterized protein n=1 Tax=Asterophora parasitica TaxID=117018 RepID=A0A9P7G490_9AGAR|nr:hypothetical protein DXG03_002583 [Asterophora parasitica]